MNYDGYLERIGSFGRYQRFVFFVVAFAGFPAAFNNMSIVFIAAKPDHWCDVTDVARRLNLTLASAMNLSLPWTAGEVKGQAGYSRCVMYDLNYTTMTTAQAYDIMATSDRSRLPTTNCRAWTYDRSVYASSIVTQVTAVADLIKVVRSSSWRHNSILESSIRWCVWKVGEVFPDPV